MMILIDLPFEDAEYGQADDHLDIGEAHSVQAAEIHDGNRAGLRGANCADIQGNGRRSVKLRGSTDTVGFCPRCQG